MNKVIIHFDHVTRACMSYQQVLAFCELDNGAVIHTTCLDFANFDNDFKVIKKDGSFISRDSLLLNDGSHTVKEIRETHDIQKMLKAGALKFKY